MVVEMVAWKEMTSVVPTAVMSASLKVASMVETTVAKWAETKV